MVVEVVFPLFDQVKIVHQSVQTEKESAIWG